MADNEVNSAPDVRYAFNSGRFILGLAVGALTFFCVYHLVSQSIGTLFLAILVMFVSMDFLTRWYRKFLWREVVLP